MKLECWNLSSRLNMKGMVGWWGKILQSEGSRTFIYYSSATTNYPSCRSLCKIFYFEVRLGGIVLIRVLGDGHLAMQERGYLIELSGGLFAWPTLSTMHNMFRQPFSSMLTLGHPKGCIMGCTGSTTRASLWYDIGPRRSSSRSLAETFALQFVQRKI